MDPTINAVWPGAIVSGPAFTVRTPPGDNASLHRAIELAERGDVLVVDGRGFRERALWGAIMSQASVNRGLRGLVVDGAVRDVSEIEELGFPVFAATHTPKGPYNKVHGSIGEPIQCGGVTVNPGDFVLGDADGVVVVPSAQLDDVFAKAHHRHKLEQKIVAGLAAGTALSDLLPILRTAPSEESDIQTPLPTSPDSGGSSMPLQGGTALGRSQNL